MKNFDEFFNFVVKDISKNNGDFLIGVDEDYKHNLDFVDDCVHPSKRETVKSYMKMLCLIRAFHEWESEKENN